MKNQYPNNMDSPQPLILVIGASGFVGKNLISELLIKTTYQIRAVARNIKKLEQKHQRLEVISGDVTSHESMMKCLKNSTVVFFLVHKLESKAGDLYDNETGAAATFASAATKAGVKRVIYLSGLGLDKDRLSKHLVSRHKTGMILRENLPEVIELRAGIIVGQGSTSFEIIRHLSSILPIIILPQQAKTLTQPIGIDDVLQYLIACIRLPVLQSEIIEIGGPEKMNYQNFLIKYASFLGKRRLIICLPVMPLWLAGWFLYKLAPKSMAQIGRNMVESFQNEMIVTNERANELFPEISPEKIGKSFF